MVTELVASIRSRIPRALVAPDILSERAGFVDITVDGKDFVIEYNQGHAPHFFGLSRIDGEDIGYGEKPDEIFETVNKVVDRLVDLLSSNGRTAH